MPPTVLVMLPMVSAWYPLQKGAAGVNDTPHAIHFGTARPFV